jgi:hypothetical protein
MIDQGIGKVVRPDISGDRQGISTEPHTPALPVSLNTGDAMISYAEGRKNKRLMEFIEEEKEVESDV